LGHVPGIDLVLRKFLGDILRKSSRWTRHIELVQDSLVDVVFAGDGFDVVVVEEKGVFEALNHIALGPAELPDLTPNAMQQLQQILVTALLHPDFALFPRRFDGLHSSSHETMSTPRHTQHSNQHTTTVVNLREMLLKLSALSELWKMLRFSKDPENTEICSTFKLWFLYQ